MLTKDEDDCDDDESADGGSKARSSVYGLVPDVDGSPWGKKAETAKG